MEQYVVFFQYYDDRDIIHHYSFDVERCSCAALTMNEIYSALRSYIGQSSNRFIITSITKL